MEEYKLAYGRTDFTFSFDPEKIIAVLRPKTLPTPESEEAVVRAGHGKPGRLTTVA
jgi:hypothetical protein